MRNRVYGVSKKYIQSLYVLMVMLSVAFPMMLMGISLKRGVTFEQSFIMLLFILGSVLFITLFHEGRKIILEIQERKLELTDTRLLIHQESKKELIFFDELKLVSIYEGKGGKVLEVILTTVYGSMTKLKHYEDLKDLVAVLRSRTEVAIHKRKHYWMPAGVTGTLVIGIVILLLI